MHAHRHTTINACLALGLLIRGFTSSRLESHSVVYPNKVYKSLSILSADATVQYDFLNRRIRNNKKLSRQEVED